MAKSTLSFTPKAKPTLMFSKSQTFSSPTVKSILQIQSKPSIPWNKQYTTA